MGLSREEVTKIGQKAAGTVFDELKEVTKTNLAKEYQKLYDLSEEVTHFSSRCHLDATFNRLSNANRAALRLNERARERYEDGLITADEYIRIAQLTEEITYRELPGRIRKNLVQECKCGEAKAIEEKFKERMPRIDPHATAIQQDKQLVEQMKWLKARGFKTAREAQEAGY